MTQAQTKIGAAPPHAIEVRSGLVEERLVFSYFVASLTLLLFAMLVGFLFSLQFLQWYPFAGIELLSPGRLRMVHTNAVAYGFIANAFLGALHWAVPRLTLHPVLNRRLSWFIFFFWQAIVLATVVGIVTGHAQAVEWGETPGFVDPLVVVGLILVAINMLTPILRSNGPMYVSLWYFIAAFVWTVLVYAMGNCMPQFFVSGTAPGAITGLFTHDLVGLLVTPIGWGLMYYFVPIILNKPIWSHGLALIGFWGLVIFYPLNGIHYFLWSPLPMVLQYVAVIATIAVEMAVATVIINFFGTIKGKGDMLRTSMAIRWFFIGMVFYFITCLQRAFQVTLTVQKITHFTDWVVGHSHLVMFGVFGFWIMGFMTYLIPRLLRASGWYRRSWNECHFWLMGMGMLIMFVDLVIAGLIQGLRWRDLAPWEDSIVASTPFWLVRTVSGIMMIIGMLFFLCNVVMTAIHCRGSARQETLDRTVGGAPNTA